MFHRPKIYTVHINPDAPLLTQQPVFVREGFSLLAFIFTGFWTLYHRLWLATLVIILVNALFMVAQEEGWAAPAIVGVLQLAFYIIVGFQANDWWRARLARKGYIIADITASENKLRAEQRYFERALAAA